MKGTPKMDFFRPTSEPARSIYDAFVAESAKRKGKPLEDWIAGERMAVLNAAVVAAQRLGLRAPTIAEVELSERCACGHSDYGAKWAYGVARAMHSSTTQSVQG